MKHANEKQLESLILLIDFKKAFDSLTHRYIDNCLKMFNFGESIRRWIKLFFSSREAYILLGGELTKKILLEQGVPQGDVVSPYIFILAVEILLIKINQDLWLSHLIQISLERPKTRDLLKLKSAHPT